MAWQTRDFVMASGISCAATGAYPAPGLNVEQDLRYSVQVNFDYKGAASGNATGTVAVQASNDGSKWQNLTGLTANYTSGTSSVLFEVTSKAHRYTRVNVSAVTGTGGTASVLFHSEYDTE